MARPDTLIPGNCYFSVSFYDTDLRLPMIDTLVYFGQEDDPDEGRLWLFKEPDLPPSPEEDDSSSDPPSLIGFSDKQLHEILDFDGLIQALREIGVDHPVHPIPRIAAEPATVDDFASVGREVATFLGDAEFVALTMTIRFTDDGLSLSRGNKGYEMNLSTRPRLGPDEDARILSLFASLGIQPCVDYRSDGGRTRILHFPIPSEADAIVDLCVRVLTEVYSMRRGDQLDYHFLRKSDIPSRD